MNEQWKDKIVIITGASSGIGFSVANILAALGAKLFLIARNQEKLEAAKTKLLGKSGSDLFIQIYAIDIGIKDEITSVITKIGEEHGRIDLLINNAGVNRCGRFDEMPPTDFEQSLQSNYLGSLYTTKAAWKYLAKANGHVTFVSSVAGYIGLIGYGPYTPTKFAMTGLAECLRMEGKPVGIKVSIIYPGNTNTPMLDYERQHALPETQNLNEGIKVIEPDYVARKLMAGIKSNKFEIYCDSKSRFYRILKAVFPGVFYKVMDKIAFG